MPEQIFLTVLELSISIGGIVVLIKLFSPLFNKYYTAKWKYWVWLILAFRLLLPVNINVAQPPVHISVPQITIVQDTERKEAAEENSAILSPSEREEPKGEINAAKTSRSITLWGIFTEVWLFGILFFLIGLTIRHRSFCKRIFRWSKPVQKEEICLRVEKSAASVHIKPPRVICSEMTSSPMVFGLFRPVLVLPHTDYAEQDFAFILQHELVHLRRLDLWYKLILSLANALHWFNPLVYLLVREANADLERSCDSEVVRGLNYEEKKAYSETILAAIRREKYFPSTFSTCFRGGKKTMEERFRNILAPSKHRRGTAALFAVLLGAGLAGGLIACDLQGITLHDENAGVFDTNAQPRENRAVKAHTVVFTGFQTAGVRKDTVSSEIKGQISPQGLCTAIEIERGPDLELKPMGMEITLPAEWEIRTPAAGEGMYNDFCTYSPVNLYKNGVCIGTMGCDRFFESQLEEWEKAWTPDGKWNPPEDYGGLYWPRMTGNCRWEGLTEIQRTEKLFVGTCQVLYEKEISGTGKAQTNKGILAHDADLLQYISIELRDDMATREELEAIARSIRLFLVTASSEQPVELILTTPAAPEGDGFEKTTILFPSDDGRYHDTASEIKPFYASLSLPKGYSVQPLSEEGERMPSCRFNLLRSKQGIFCEGKQIGTIGCNAFKNIPEAEGAYMAVYNEIMLGSLVSWDINYTPVAEAEDFRFCNAVCRLAWKEVPQGEAAAGIEYEYCPAVLSYNRDLQVYIGAAFEENSITQEQQKAIARSIVLHAEL